MKLRFPFIFLLIIFLAIGFLGITLPAQAQNVGFEASVDRKSVTLGDAIQLSLTVYGNQQASALKLPEIDGFQSRYLGPSTSVSIINGKHSSSVSHRYLLFPQKIGTFQIPALQIELGGKTYSSNPIAIDVVESNEQVKSDDQSSTAPSANVQDKVFLTMQANKNSVYLNEKIDISVKLFVSQVALRDISFPEINTEGFVAEQIAQPSQSKELKDGAYYDTVEFYLTLYPVREGGLSVGPAKVDANILYKKQRQRGSFFDEFGMMDDGFFGDLFGSYEKYPITFQADPLKINVKPLPQPVPNNFSSAVGQFNFTVTASPKKVNVGDPITVRMDLSGNGNLKNVKMPVFSENDEFKVYDPQIKEEEGSKILEQVLIPKKENITHIPAIQFTYFDVNAGVYQTLTRGPFEISVSPAKEQQPLNVIALPNTPMATETKDQLGRDIVFIKDSPGKFTPIGKALYKNIFFLAVVILYTIVIVLFFVFYKRKERVRTDLVYAKRLKAPAKARKGLKKIYQLIHEGKEKQFYDGLFEFLKEYLHYKLAVSEGSVTAHEIQDSLLKKGVSELLSKKISAAFAECEAIRYGALSSDKTKMQESCQALKEIVDALERLNL
ncbi:MAG: BatD family protein [Candidatus Aceula meridiana]|nr:BatD family protein [Candidatus Aceula meridiana]